MKKAYTTVSMLLMLLASSALMAAPDYAEIRNTIGMSKEQVKARFGPPDKAMDPMADPNSQGTWAYRRVIHPDSGKKVSCFLYFYPGGIAKVVCS